MKETIKKYLLVIFIFLSFSLQAFGYLYEAPISTRKMILVILGIFYLIIIVIQHFIKKRLIRYFLILMAAITLIGIEMYSKYAINYFYHSSYIIVLMYIIVHYPKKQGLFLSIILTISSIVKFVELIWIQPSQANIAIFLFFFIIQFLVLLVGFFAKVYREENTKTNLLYIELLETNKQLVRYSDELKQLTKIEERTNIARDLHDTLGHDMTGLIMQMEMVTRLFKNNESLQGFNVLEEAKKSARESLSKVRQILNTLKEDTDIDWTSSSLQSLINDFAKKTNTIIKYDISGEKNVKPDIGITLYRSIQEALTNAIRHGKASNIVVTIKYLEDGIKFCIQDNGTGCPHINKGNGLIGMTERIKLLKGEVFFESSKTGFMVKGSIPYEGEEVK